MPRDFKCRGLSRREDPARYSGLHREEPHEEWNFSEVWGREADFPDKLKSYAL